MRRERGFPLIELLAVLGIVALLPTLTVPRFFPSVNKTKEMILAENLRTTRAVIDHFYADTGCFPDSLDQLVEKKYLPRLPLDPVLDSDASWVVVPPEDPCRGNVYDIPSGVEGKRRNGKSYAK